MSCEALLKARCALHEVPGARHHDTLSLQLARQRIADPLERNRVPAGGHERWNLGVAQPLERRARLSWEPSAVSVPDAIGELLRQWAIGRQWTIGRVWVVEQRLVIGLVWRARERQEVAEYRGVGLETVSQHRVSHALQIFDFGIISY